MDNLLLFVVNNVSSRNLNKDLVLDKSLQPPSGFTKSIDEMRTFLFYRNI